MTARSSRCILPIGIRVRPERVPHSLAVPGCAAAGQLFAVAQEVWQSHFVMRHVLGGIPLAEREALTSLSSLLRRKFSEPTPNGLEWRVISKRFPSLRPPSEVVLEYTRMLALIGFLTRGSDGLWRATRAAASARNRRDAAAQCRVALSQTPPASCR